MEAWTDHDNPGLCPFCGGQDTEFAFSGEGPPPCYFVICEDCGAQGPYGHGMGRGDHEGAKGSALKRWNVRCAKAFEGW